jgi:integrase
VALVDLLAEHAARQGRAGADLLFLDDEGHPFNRNSAGNRWRTVRAAAGLDTGMTLHSLRHFFASGLIAAGCDVVTVQRALGHSSPSITLNVYSHLWPKADDRTRAAATELMTAVLDPVADSLRTDAVPHLR